MFGVCLLSVPLLLVLLFPFTMPPETNSNDFGSLKFISRFKFEFFSLRKSFFEGFEFFGVQSSTTCNATVHVPVLWPVCAHAIPFRMLWRP